MSAGFSHNQRSTGGHRPPLQQTKTALQFCNTLKLGRRGGSMRTTPSSLTSFEASPYRARASREASPYFLRLRSIALALRAGSRFAVREATPPNLGGESSKQNARAIGS